MSLPSDDDELLSCSFVNPKRNPTLYSQSSNIDDDGVIAPMPIANKVNKPNEEIVLEPEPAVKRPKTVVVQKTTTTTTTRRRSTRSVSREVSEGASKILGMASIPSTRRPIRRLPDEEEQIKDQASLGGVRRGSLVLKSVHEKEKEGKRYTKTVLEEEEEEIIESKKEEVVQQHESEEQPEEDVEQQSLSYYSSKRITVNDNLVEKVTSDLAFIDNHNPFLSPKKSLSKKLSSKHLVASIVELDNDIQIIRQGERGKFNAAIAKLKKEYAKSLVNLKKELNVELEKRAAEFEKEIEKKFALIKTKVEKCKMKALLGVDGYENDMNEMFKELEDIKTSKLSLISQKNAVLSDTTNKLVDNFSESKEKSTQFYNLHAKVLEKNDLSLENSFTWKQKQALSNADVASRLVELKRNDEKIKEECLELLERVRKVAGEVDDVEVLRQKRKYFDDDEDVVECEGSDDEVFEDAHEHLIQPTPKKKIKAGIMNRFFGI